MSQSIVSKQSRPLQETAPRLVAGGAIPFSRRHVGPSDADVETMLDVLGTGSAEELLREAIPTSLHEKVELDLPQGQSETALHEVLRARAAKNENWRSYVGLGYHGTVMPAAIRRNVLENPDWYTAYTPYQAEISQGRLEALLNFQTLTSDLTGLPIANASLLDEGTAAAEAMLMLHRATREEERDLFFVSEGCHPRLMIEPTESESRAELDRFCEAMIAIREEIAMIERGDVDAEESPLKQAPHTASMIATGDWPYPYSRERAAFPAPWTRANKTWPAVRRVDAAYGDRNLTCTCPPLDAYEEPT